MMKKSLDFVVIGAQKSATTSLHHYLTRHPSLFLPPQKELPFFTRARLEGVTFDDFLETYFKAADEDNLVGKVTPHYMSDAESPALLASLLPGAKLIAILRDPIERAYSQYKMAVRHGHETGDFETALERQLKQESLKESRTLSPLAENEARTYVAWSEYGRVLAGFLDHYPADALLLVYAEQLRSEPMTVLRKVYRFLGVEDFEPDNLGVLYHRGGTRHRSAFLRSIVGSAWINRIGQLLPKTLRGRVLCRLDMWNSKGKDDGMELSAETQERMRAHFSQDLGLLASRFVVEVPWGARYGLPQNT